MNPRMYQLTFALLIFVLPSCHKHTSAPVSHPPITGQWQYQYTTAGLGPNQDTVYPQRDSTIQLVFTTDHNFTLLLNGTQRGAGTWQWQDTILVLTSSVGLNAADYAQGLIFNSTNPSHYGVQAGQSTLSMSRLFFIPNAPGPYSVPLEPQIEIFTPIMNPGGPNE